MEYSKEAAKTTAKRVTRRLCVVNGMHWHDLLQYEESICKPERSWSYRNWVTFLLRLGLTEEQIFEIAQKRLTA
jgi:hypothetical protein